MPKPAITIEVLPAGFGDCLLVSCPIGRRTWRMLVDTGPDEAFPQLKSRLCQLPVGADGKRHIDLFVVSHIDHDHIGGVSLLLNDQALALSFGDIWFNSPPARTMRGVAEGQSLATLLGATESGLPWNLAFAGKPVMTDGGPIELSKRSTPRITLLSPTVLQLENLYRVWAKELERLRRKERDQPDPERPVMRGAIPSVEELAARRTSTDRAVPNGSSIAILLEHRGASVLLAADAFPDVLIPSIQALQLRRGTAGPLKLDAFKLSHHGSRANVTSDLLSAVKAEHYIFSTNNSYFSHPNDEAVARVILHGGPGPTLWFNYDTERNRKWAQEGSRAKYGYEVRLPDQTLSGVKLTLAVRRAPR